MRNYDDGSATPCREHEINGRGMADVYERLLSMSSHESSINKPRRHVILYNRAYAK